MLTTNQLTASENISLSKELGLVANTLTPITSLLIQKGQVERATAKVHSWIEKSLDLENNISVTEGHTPSTFVNSGRAELSNVLQIFQKAGEISNTVLSMPNISEGDIYATEANDRLIEMKLALEYALVNSQKDTGATTPFIRKMDGLLNWVAESNVLVPAEAVSETVIKNLAKTLWQQGANRDMYLFTNADLKEQIDALYKNSYQYNHLEENFGLVVSSINTNYGQLKVILSNVIPQDTLLAADLSAIKLAYLREPALIPMGVTSDGRKFMVVTEATVRVDSPRALASFTLSE